MVPAFLEPLTPEKERERENKEKMMRKCSNPYNEISLGTLGAQEQNLEVWEGPLEEVTFSDTKGRVRIQEAKAERRIKRGNTWR